MNAILTGRNQPEAVGDSRKGLLRCNTPCERNKTLQVICIKYQWWLQLKSGNRGAWGSGLGPDDPRGGRYTSFIIPRNMA